MRAEIHSPNTRPSTRPPAALTLQEFNNKTLSPPVPVYLPWNLTAQEFLQILDSPSDKPAFKFPALRNWLSGLLRALDAQQDESHPFHKQPYRLEELTIESVDWFDKKEYTRIGYMKIQSEIRNGSGNNEWIPGGAFLRGGSVAILVCFSFFQFLFSEHRVQRIILTRTKGYRTANRRLGRSRKAGRSDSSASIGSFESRFY
jgi:ADP-sugar diphosphatase